MSNTINQSVKVCWEDSERSKMKLLTILSLIILSGCVHSSSMKVGSPDGSEWIGIRCRNHLYCLQEAGDVCPNGYDVEDTTPTNHSMVIKCHPGARNQVVTHEIHYFGEPTVVDNPDDIAHIK